MPASNFLCRLAAAALALVAVGGVVVAAPPALAQQADLETRLRDALRQATARTRTLEDDNARLRARQAELEAEIARLRPAGGEAGQPSLAAQTARIAELERLFGEREKAFQAAVDEFNARLAEERQQALQIQEAGQRWKTAHDEAVRLARGKEAERQALARELDSASSGVAACAARNRELYAVGSEILDRYQEVGVGDVLARREPFIGIKRVELETLVQDYQDRLLDNRVSGEAASAAGEQPVAAPSPR